MTTLSIPVPMQLVVIALLSILSICIYQSCSQSTVSKSITSQSTVSLINSSCQQSLVESDGFICEPDYLWNERKYVYHAQDKENMMKRKDPIYFVSNWEPNFHCSHAQRIGAMGDGGKWVCDPYRLKLRPDCLVYSVGSRGDFSFEIQMKKIIPHCEIHTFDRRLYSCPTSMCNFHQMIFGNGIEPNGSRSWLTIVQELNHTNRLIDILKIDIEGGEYSFFPLVFNSTKNLFPRQILVELHPRNAENVYLAKLHEKRSSR
ncbi:unnamed protein product [Rotaria sordida]|uniref:Methyltransferase domain-containing protein n=1 Tax=Rotaria sordida TaxID=392033 RepID=A0A815K8P9_9BILA|nr:unnamed protein product [Rotaria sordida]CAF1629729.1 unnamed protein product [Rotaria sordida]